MTRSKEAWFSEELLNARLSMQNMEGVSRETVGALVGLIDEAVVGKVSLWQRRIAELETALTLHKETVVWVLKNFNNNFNDFPAHLKAIGDEACLAAETSAERCKHGVWAADRCEQCVKETEAKGG